MARLGSKKRPAIVRVSSPERAQQLLAICKERGWQLIVGVEPHAPEDVSDLDQLLSPPQPLIAAHKIGPNQPCPCNSGVKYKKCCARAPQEEH